ncbi:hypothetical protein [Tenggerimyces flavus]|uniref:SRPBCC family protein n=1 Tax=Tenggerimyces flavus TaxID=1708749 RepID=A0ABV7YN46_9ACTN|nr:hypothetical protein [Tenggerimyces flavus]MBM7790453.1 hypothetical protein [Tenggerimyces flavus]
MFSNVHTRVIAAPRPELGKLLERITEPDSPSWPSRHWPPMVLDNGLEVGSAGGHGPIRYYVTDHQPGSRIEFTFDDVDLPGTHALELHDGPTPGTTLVRHILIGYDCGLRNRLTWEVGLRWLHDALIEQLFDRLATVAGKPPARPLRWSPWVKALRLLYARNLVPQPA